MPIFYSDSFKKNDKKIEVYGEEFHHIVNVFRKPLGANIHFTNGNGLIAETKIIDINKKSLSAQIIQINEFSMSQPKIAVAFSLLRNKNDHLLIEKLTELGVKEFYPMETEFTVRKANRNTTEKFQKVAISAIKQCDNAFLPIIHNTLNLEQQLEKIKKNEYEIIIASELEKNHTIHSIINEVVHKSICILIGPEGGFSPKEHDYFAKNEMRQIKLGNHIMRAETAAISAVSQLIGIYLNRDINYY